jgi:zinc transporter 9
MDGGLCVAKLGAFALTGSASMLSEGLHSLADVSNQTLLAIGIRASRRPPDEKRPYGYGRARPFWALLSASGVLFVGAGATLWNGIGRLFDPEPLDHLELGLAILALGLLSEAVSITIATRTVLRQARQSGTSLREALTHSGDPVLVAIIAEDTAGLAGVLSAAAGVGLSYAFANPMFDAVGAIGVGLVMATAALFLIDRNRQLLLGSAVSSARRDELVEALSRSPLVHGVRDVKTTAFDESTVRFKAEVAFDGAALADEWLAAHDAGEVLELEDPAAVRGFLRRFAQHVVLRLGREVDRIEAEIQSQDPGIRHIDLEMDAVTPDGHGSANRGPADPSRT